MLPKKNSCLEMYLLFLMKWFFVWWKILLLYDRLGIVVELLKGIWNFFFPFLLSICFAVAELLT